MLVDLPVYFRAGAWGQVIGGQMDSLPAVSLPLLTPWEKTDQLPLTPAKDQLPVAASIPRSPGGKD